MALEQDETKAYRIARAIVSDVILYNTEKVKKGIENDSLFEEMSNEIAEGRKLFESRVDIAKFPTLYDRALVDVMFKQGGRFPSKIW